ncbi:MAG TPA: cobalt-precorrin-5B (C(1))-methyltransferase [Rhodobacteraceae bacterium]|nr:cobalt-precorrin-5B (C(1))-methyltransferase [Paracoccaceae bacterium]
MKQDPAKTLRRGWTTGACATAATKAALMALWGGGFPEHVSITLPKGETPDFAVVNTRSGAGWAEAGIIKDAGDDPDVTHGAEVRVRVSASAGGVEFAAGEGVGIVTKPGLPVPVGEPAINPKPREMICEVIEELAVTYGKDTGITVRISIVNGADLALKTWNPRLGINGGLSVLGTTGVVRPFSCSAWIASIHRGVDVARASGLTHVAGCTGATSEATVQALYSLPDHAMLDMGDFAGGLLKYIRRHPVARLTIGGGIGKITKLAQGAVDLHSGRSQVDFTVLAGMVGDERLAKVNTALEAYEIAGDNMVDKIAKQALVAVRDILRDADILVDIVIIDRAGNIIARAGE